MKKHIALGLVASTLFLAGCCTTHHTTKWEYKEVAGLMKVNELCKAGWILVNVNHHENTEDSYLMKHEAQ
jgi:protein involved in sex pheromone biosynthesis